MFVVSRTVTSRTQRCRCMSTAMEAFQRSCYLDRDYMIKESETVARAVEKLVGNDFGCLVTTDDRGNVSGVLSERDVIQKWAVLETPLPETSVADICTQNPFVVMEGDVIEECMAKMMQHDIRHLPVVSSDGKTLSGMISIKDCVKIVVEEKEETIRTLSNFAVGKTGHFVVD